LSHRLEKDASERLESVSANQRAYYDFAARPPIADGLSREEVDLFVSRRSFYNSVVATRSTPERCDELVDEVIDLYASRGVGRFAWRVRSEDRPRDLADRLVDRGFDPVDVGPMMSLDLCDFDEPASGAGLEIRTVIGSALARSWAGVVVPGFGLDEAAVGPHGRWLEALGYGLPLRSFVGFHRSRAVAAVQTFLDDGVVGLYWIGVVPDARRRGFGREITRHAIDRAKRDGARRAVLHANEPAIAVYEGLGFASCGSVTRYVWRKESVARPS